MNIEREKDIWSVGGKAYNLMRLQDYFSNVPDFFVLRFNSEDELNNQKNREIIIEECLKLKSDYYSIRSSATCEDGEQESFSGIFDSCVCVVLSDIFNAIEFVLKSSHSQKVANYLNIKKKYENFEMRVIVQRQLDSNISGVCFTKHPNYLKNTVIEACYGQGETLVDGSITPDMYIVSSDYDQPSLISFASGFQQYAKYLDYDNHVSKEAEKYSCTKTVKINKSKSVLSLSQINSIVKQSLIATDYLKFESADIEWAYEGGVLFFLQIRPITL